jgi:long-chain acyl-CoA synthetase
MNVLPDRQHDLGVPTGPQGLFRGAAQEPTNGDTHNVGRTTTNRDTRTEGLRSADNSKNLVGEDLANIVKRFADGVQNHPLRPAFRSRDLPRRSASHIQVPGLDARTDKHPKPPPTPEGWGELNWADYGEQVSLLASAFLEWGLERGDRVAVLSENRWEWHVADVAILSLGAISVPIYPTSSASQIRYILHDCGARICVVSNEAQFAQVCSVGSQECSLIHVLTMDSVRQPEAQPDAKFTTNNWIEAIECGKAAVGHAETLLARAAHITRTDTATIVYTSGTTGPPKGVTLTHGNIAVTVDMLHSVVGLFPNDRFLSFLPLSHIAERMISHFGQIASGGETWFARSFSTVAVDIVDCRPTLFFAVPRVWEKIRDAFQIEEHRSSLPQRTLLGMYQRSNAKCTDISAHGRRTPTLARLQNVVLTRIVGRPIRKKLGLDQARGLFSGAAPIDPKLLVWLENIGLRVGEVYGQTEVCGPTSVSPPDAIRIGAAGRPLPGMHVEIANDGELLVSGPNLCAGYFNNPVATAELFDADGRMRTGDLGRLDSDGYLWITGRKKDLMKTAQGKYIAPEEMETKLRSLRFVANAMIIAEGRPYVTALLTLDAEATGPWADHRGKPASLEALALDPDVLSEISRGVESVNAEYSHAEQIKRWRVLPRDLTVDGGELTPTLKMVRSKVAKNFSESIDELYAMPSASRTGTSDTATAKTGTSEEVAQ